MQLLNKPKNIFRIHNNTNRNYKQPRISFARLISTSKSKAQQEYWNTEDVHRNTLERIGRERFGVKELDDWYSVSAKNVHRQLPFLHRYGSLFNALKKFYPQHNWDPLRLSKVPSGHWTDENSQRDALERIGREKFGVKELDDWYTVPRDNVYRSLGFIKNYGSLFNALKTLYPQHNWDALRFSRVPSGYWSDESTHKDALERIGRERFGVKELDDWYHVPAHSLHRELSFVRKYGSLYHALKKLYPQHNWDPLRFSMVPHGYWLDENTQRDALEKTGRERLGVKELDDWYSVAAEVVVRELSFIKAYYRGSLLEALKKLYPQHNWDPLRFSKIRYWSDENRQRDALERLGKKKFGVKELDDWYSITTESVRSELRFVQKYGSLYEALKKLYPQHNWDPNRFPKAPRRDVNTDRELLEEFGRTKLGVKELDDWYSVVATDVHNELRFIKKYGSLYDALKKIYPQHNWDPLRFRVVPRGHWTDENAQRDALERIGRELGVRELDDWYSVSADSVRHELSFIQKYGSLFNALKKFYPQHDWDPLRFMKVPSGYWNDESTQRSALEKLGREKFGVKELDDWYAITTESVRNELNFIYKYGSLYEALKKLYPQHDWDPNRFPKVPRHDVNDHRAALERIGRDKLGVNELDDWYSVPSAKVYRELGFVKKYGSLIDALKTFYPQHNWDPLRLSRTPHGYWEQPSIVQHYHKMFTEWKTTHNIRSISEWYQLSPQQLMQFKRAAKGIFGSHMKMLEKWFPDTVWQWQFTSQLELKSLLKQVIADSNMKHHRSTEDELEESPRTRRNVSNGLELLVGNGTTLVQSNFKEHSKIS